MKRFFYRASLIPIPVSIISVSKINYWQFLFMLDFKGISSEVEIKEALFSLFVLSYYFYIAFIYSDSAILGIQVRRTRMSPLDLLYFTAF